MPRAMIFTVGSQCKQIKFCIERKKPEYIVLLGTRSPCCKAAMDDVVEHVRLPATNFRIYCEADDSPGEIGTIIRLFRDGFAWLTNELHVPRDDVEVDPTGGRKWMSAGVTMAASFLGLEMCYVQNDSPKMDVLPLGNAYEQAGFIEEDRADHLFNSHGFEEAARIYERLRSKMRDPRTVEAKLLIARGYMAWTRFRFQESCDKLSQALEKIQVYGVLKEKEGILKKQVELLRVLKKNDEKTEDGKQRHSFFSLLRTPDFPETAVLFLFSLQAAFAKDGLFEQAAIVLYRTVEFLAQWKLALRDVDTGKVPDSIKKDFDGKFRECTKRLFGGERAISTRIGLLESWLLLRCMDDAMVRGKPESFFKGLRAQTEPRNALWIEHGNQSVEEAKYEKFQQYVKGLLTEVVTDYEDRLNTFGLIRFPTCGYAVSD